MTRIADIEDLSLTFDQQRIFDEIAAGPRGKVEGPLRVWLHSSGLAEPAQALGAFCRYGTTLSPRLSELAIVTVGAFWRAGFEFATHAPIAMSLGVPETVIDDLRHGRVPADLNEDETLIFDFVTAILEKKNIDETLFSTAIKRFGAQSVVELVGVIGYYCLICLTINAFEIDAPDGVDPFSEHPAGPHKQIV